MASNPTFPTDAEKGGLPPPYAEGSTYPGPQNAPGSPYVHQQGAMPPPPPGNYMGPQAPPGAYGVPVGGYQGQPAAGYPPAPSQTFMVTNTTTQSSRVGSMNSMVPVMPMWAAIILCVVNCILPGFGTMIAGMTVCCCADVPQNSGSSKFGLFCINFWMGWGQILTLWCFLMGWIWSIWWGILFITMSAEYYGKQQPTSTTTTIIQQTNAR